MKKIKFILLSALSTLLLTSCSLFNDNDIVVENHFKTKEEASQEKELPTIDLNGDDVAYDDIKIGETEASVFKNVVYSNMEVDGVKKIKNTYKDLGSSFHINESKDYDVNPDNNNFDIYIPKGLKTNEDQTVALFVHGGAWVSGLKTHVNPYVKEFTKRGFISATIEYTLLNKDFDHEHKDLSIFRDLDEIDACISTMKSLLVEYGFTGKLSLVIGGVSSGAHLSMLYAYSRGESIKDSFPIKFIVDAVGPTDIKEDVWKAFDFGEGEEADYAAAMTGEINSDAIAKCRTDGNLKPLEVSGEGYNWTQFQTMKIANGMCGFQFSPEEVEAAAADSKHDLVKAGDVYNKMISNSDSGENLLSVTSYITDTNIIPIICAYAGQDSVVGIAQFANLEVKLKSKGYVKESTYEYFFFETAGHTNIDKPEEQVKYDAFMNKIEDWLKTK